MKTKFTSPIPGEQFTSYEAFDALPRSGKLGPWTERVIAAHRTLQSVSYALDGLSSMPAELQDGVLEQEVTSDVRDAVCTTQDLVARLIRIETPIASQSPQSDASCGGIPRPTDEPEKVPKAGPDPKWDAVKELFADDPLIAPSLAAIEKFAGSAPPRLWFACTLNMLATSTHDIQFLQQSMANMIAAAGGIDSKLSY